MRRAVTVSSAVLLAAAVTGLLPSRSRAESGQPLEVAALEWPLLFSARKNGERMIFRLDSPGGEPVAIGGQSGRDNRAVPSPDGSLIAFQSQRDGNYEIYVVERDGSKPRNLTRNPSFDGLPVWSPDGERIAFFSNRDVGEGIVGEFPGHLFVMRADGSEVARLPVPPLVTTLGPSGWSPDGERLLLTRKVDGQFDLFALALEGFAETRLTFDAAVEGSATYSPDGSRIAFYAETAEGADIVILDVANGERRVLTPAGGYHYYPEWSPDGAWVTTTSLGEGDQYDVLVWAVDGSGSAALVATAADERESIWLPTAAPAAEAE